MSISSGFADCLHNCLEVYPQGHGFWWEASAGAGFTLSLAYEENDLSGGFIGVLCQGGHCGALPACAFAL